VAIFTDAAGRTWELRITYGNKPRLAAAGCDVDLVVEDRETLARVFTRADPLFAAVWELCGPDAAARGVSREQFADGIDGPARFRMAEALEAAVMDFSQPPPLATALKERRAGAMDRVIAAAVTRIDAELAGSTGSGTNSPGPPGSAPAPTPSAS